MSCVNPNDPRFKEILQQVGNPLLAEIEFDRLYPDPNESLYQTVATSISEEEFTASEKTIRDLAARMADRIGIPYKIISDRTEKYKGKIENNQAIINLAYATLDTPIHEILGHPIIRAIKNVGNNYIYNQEYNQIMDSYLTEHPEKSREEGIAHADRIMGRSNVLYQNLLKELEYGTGKEILDRIKRDYEIKDVISEIEIDDPLPDVNQYGVDITDHISKLIDTGDSLESIVRSLRRDFLEADPEWLYFNYPGHQPEYYGDEAPPAQTTVEEVLSLVQNTPLRTPTVIYYTLEEQQEEALVELLGLMTAKKLDAVKDGKLISLLKRLLKEIKAFVKELLGKKEIDIDTLPDNMTIGDIADILAYSNSKLILPGYEVEYTTPDNQTFKTYQEASNHISQLAKESKDVNLSDVNVNLLQDIINKKQGFVVTNDGYQKVEFIDGEWYDVRGDNEARYIINEEEVKNLWQSKVGYSYIESFIEKNKEYEQSKEIIETWKKENNIQYNPEEIYSRGQEFVSVIGAYSSFDVNLMMQNLLQHIEDNEKAGGKFAISAFTKPIGKTLNHLEGGGGKIKIKIYPQSKDILWAANTDVYSGSVWDASDKISKDKKSELLGVSYTKYPGLGNVSKVQPNLASIVDDLAHYHNELGIVLTGNNFRLEYDDDIPYSTKKIIDGINAILNQKYGKIVKPEIKKTKSFVYNIIVLGKNGVNVVLENEEFETVEEVKKAIEEIHLLEDQSKFTFSYRQIQKDIPIKPTQTKENLKESIESVKSRIGVSNDYSKQYGTIQGEPFEVNGKLYLVQYNVDSGKFNLIALIPNGNLPIMNGMVSKTEALQLGVTQERVNIEKEKLLKYKEKEYTEQALINTKIAKLKEVAKKYPRSLIRSEVKEIRYEDSDPNFDMFEEELPFQKIPSPVTKENNVSELFESNPELADEVYKALGVGENIVGKKWKEVVKNYLVTPAMYRARLRNYEATLQRLKEDNYTLPRLRTEDLNKLLSEEKLALLKYYSEVYLNNAGTITSAPSKITEEDKLKAQELYSKYLDSIFPDSKVKDIVRHDTNNKFWEGYLPNGKDFKSKRGIYFNPTSGNEGGFANASYKIKAIINLINPTIKDMDNDYAAQNTNELYPNNDGVIGYVESPKQIGEYIVSKPEQIHILGSEEDIKGFKEYIKDEKQELIDNKRQSILAIGYQKEAADNTYVPLSEEHKQLLESARENLNPVEADRVEQMLKGETRFLDDSNFEMC